MIDQETWKLIKLKCPLAYKEVDKWTNSSTLEEFYNRVHWHDRRLYDFFDERGIWVSIEFSGVNRFTAKIEAGMFKNYWLGNDGDRKWAENKAFLGAFEVLESRLEDVEVTKKNKAFFK